MVLFLLLVSVYFGLLISAPLFVTNFLAALLLVAFAARYFRKIRMDEDILPELTAQAVVLGVFLLYRLLENNSAVFYLLLTKASLGFSGFVGAIIGRPIQMGITYSGIDVFALFSIAHIVIALLSSKKPFKRLNVPLNVILCTLVWCFVWGFYIALWTVLAENSFSLGLHFFEPLTGALDFRLILFALFSLVFTAFCSAKTKRSGKTADKHTTAAAGVVRRIISEKKTAIAAFAFLAVMSVLTSIFSIQPKAPQIPDAHSNNAKIVFWDSGIDFSVPEKGRYGLDNAGMFGILPEYLTMNGYTCETVRDISEETLKDADVLVIFNLNIMPDEKALSAIWSFAEMGGGVLAVGDHTGHKEIRLPFNTILEPVGIEFNFDSAIPFKSLWADSFSLRKSPIFAGVTESRLQIVVGASLELGFRAKPLLIGKTGYSDFGNIDNVAEGYLGDMHFNRGERIGDLVLVACAEYGKGRFLVFGDTTTFQNTIISYAYPFVDNVFAYLCPGAAAGVSGKAEAPDNGENGGNNFFLASCIIDTSRQESIDMNKSGRSLDGFIAACLRNRIMPYISADGLAGVIQARPDAKLVLLLEPARSLTAQDVAALDAFMEGGSYLMICADYNSPSASGDLLSRYGLGADNLAIGRVSPDQDPGMAFWNACPILHDGEYLDPEDPQSVIAIWGYTVIAKKQYGSGGLYFIADAGFLRNKNLEDVDTYREGNILFLDSLFDEILESVQ